VTPFGAFLYLSEITYRLGLATGPTWSQSRWSHPSHNRTPVSRCRFRVADRKDWNRLVDRKAHLSCVRVVSRIWAQSHSWTHVGRP